MKKRLRKIICFVLIFALVIVSSSVSFAAEVIPTSDSEQLEMKIQTEINQMKEEIFPEVYEQLKEQGALEHYEIYKSDLSREIEARVRSKYTIQPMGNYLAKYGGVLYYTAKVGNAEVVKTYLDKDCTSKYILKDSHFTIKTILAFVLGVIPNWGIGFSALIGLSSIASNAVQQKIKDTGGYGMIMNVKTATENSSVVMVWNSYSKIPQPTGTVNGSNFKPFGAH